MALADLYESLGQSVTQLGGYFPFLKHLIPPVDGLKTTNSVAITKLNAARNVQTIMKHPLVSFITLAGCRFEFVTLCPKKK